jgi:lipopolysaccharide export system protein LptA
VKKLLLGLLLICSNAYANQAADEAIDITSDKLVVKRLQNVAVFSGQVKSIYQDMTLTCDKMVLEYDPNSKTDKKIKYVKAYGHVKLVQGLDVITSEYAEYLLNSDEILFKKDVILNRNNNLLTGDHLVINTVTKEAKMTTKPSKQVRATYYNKKGLNNEEK